MKKVILSALFVGGMFSMAAFAQQDNGFENSLGNQARRALDQAGCLDGYNGSYITHYRYQITPLLDNCYRVTLYPIANPTIAEFVRLGPAGSVTFCNGEVTDVHCGQ